MIPPDDTPASVDGFTMVSPTTFLVESIAGADLKDFTVDWKARRLAVVATAQTELLYMENIFSSAASAFLVRLLNPTCEPFYRLLMKIWSREMNSCSLESGNPTLPKKAETGNRKARK